MIKFYFGKNSSIILVHPIFIIIRYEEERSTKLGRWTGLDRGEGYFLSEGITNFLLSVTQLQSSTNLKIRLTFEVEHLLLV